MFCQGAKKKKKQGDTQFTIHPGIFPPSAVPQQLRGRTHQTGELGEVMFFPPVSFGLVEEGLYRSALPNEINYPFLERLGLKTIIYLYPDDDIDAQL